MFKIDCFVKDKDVGEVLKRLTNIAMNVNYVFVPNVESASGGKVYQTSKDATDMMSKELYKRKLTEITGPEFKAMIMKLGMNPTSVHHYIGGLLAAGVLKKKQKVKNTMLYTVTGK